MISNCKAVETIRKAATLIILAPSQYFKHTQSSYDNFPFKVLLLQRNSKTKFMKSSFVFPGGVFDQEQDFKSFRSKVEEDENLLQSNQHSLPSNLHTKRWSYDDWMYRICAIRETFEECGLCLTEPPLQEQFRKKIHNQEVTFYDACSQFNSQPQLNRLQPFERWITPSQEIRRYDTYFYVTRLNTPEELNTVIHDGNEMVNIKWVSPLEALAISKELLLPPPTWKIIRELASLNQETLKSLEMKAANIHNNSQNRNEAIPHHIPSNSKIETPSDFLHVFYSNNWFQQYFRNQFDTPICPTLSFDDSDVSKDVNNLEKKETSRNLRQLAFVHLGNGRGHIKRTGNETLYEFIEEDALNQESLNGWRSSNELQSHL